MSLPLINYPFIPEGRSFSYVTADDAFMAIAKEITEQKGCRKHATGAVLVKDGMIVAKGNNAGTFVTVCPRVYKGYGTGEGYQYCKEYCHQDGHAEVMTIRDAKAQGIDTNGTDLYLYGHWWACQNCWQEIMAAGINHVYLVKGSEISFNHEHLGDREHAITDPLKVYISGSLTRLEEAEAKSLYETIGTIVAKRQMDPYIPHLHSDPDMHPDRSAEEVYKMDKEQVAASDLMICVVNEPSLGVGQEIEIANREKTLVILVSKAGIPVSRMSLGSPNIIDHLQYTDEQDLIQQLTLMLEKFVETAKQANVSINL